ncbi:hypothetical protein EJB05_19604 [Eragrostis curvula]|uniref:Uncharacterized protein n=1 Tax=Eragrostis curvula TaxID=38414 RepID=A0A5J9SLZ6_9POAL|nr:hypothetical protein EJB05_54639 [Eragrostis curvula]TVU28095.1 hypothetical protein EJB05_19604 [Eragrostis curvula]
MQRQHGLSLGPKQLEDDANDHGNDVEQAMEAPEEVPSRVDRARSARLERAIHLIPLLTFICFLLLYLCSHDPSTSGASSLGGGEGEAANRRFRML